MSRLSTINSTKIASTCVGVGEHRQAYICVYTRISYNTVVCKGKFTGCLNRKDQDIMGLRTEFCSGQQNGWVLVMNLLLVWATSPSLWSSSCPFLKSGEGNDL